MFLPHSSSVELLFASHGGSFTVLLSVRGVLRLAVSYWCSMSLMCNSAPDVPSGFCYGFPQRSTFPIPSFRGKLSLPPLDSLLVSFPSIRRRAVGGLLRVEGGEQ